MHRALHTVFLIVICGLLAGAPRAPAGLPGDSGPGSKVVYNLFATDGYAALDDGSKLHIFGFIGGREGEPLSYQDAGGPTQTLVQGPPQPAAGPLTAGESELRGHAQLLAPVIWATTNDVVEVRLKNLGGAAAGSPATPLGLEFRGLAGGDYADGAPETSVLAIPAGAETPGAGNVLVYVFRVAQPGTYAYGWRYEDHQAHNEGSGSGAQAGSSLSMPANCPCRAMQMRTSAQAMPMDATAQAVSPGAAGPISAAMDGAVVVYGPGDPAVKTGPGTGAGGVFLGLRYDLDFVMLITGGQGATADMAGMAGMAMTTPAQVLLVDGRLPGSPAAAVGAGRPVQANYRPFLPPSGGESRRALVRILNLSGQPQPVAAATQGYRPAAYRSRQLPWGDAAVAGASWAEGSGAPESADAASPAVQPGESFDVLLDLAVRPALAAGQRVPYNAASAGSGGAVAPTLATLPMMTACLPATPMTGTLPAMDCRTTCPLMAAMASNLAGSAACRMTR